MTDHCATCHTPLAPAEIVCCHDCNQAQDEKRRQAAIQLCLQMTHISIKYGDAEMVAQWRHEMEELML